MPWIYKVNEKKFYLNGKFKFSAQYAGAVGYKNNVEFECIKDKGSLPRGTYRIEHPTNVGITGPYFLPLTPLTAANMCHRNSFRIHGDSLREPGTASRGCIIAVRDKEKNMGQWG